MPRPTCDRQSAPIARRRFLHRLGSALFATRTACLFMPSTSVFAQPVRPTDSPPSGPPDASGARPAGYTLAPWTAGPTPPLTLTDLRGQSWSLSAQRGRVVLLNFWATWCEPCRAEMPALQALAERLGPARLAVIGVNYQESEARIERFVAAAALTFPVLLDRDGAATRAWTRRIFPTSVLVGPDGRARQVIVGEFDWNGPQAASLITALLPR